MNFKAFTLAETLITVGIIGIIAALTLQSLIENHQKKITVTRLKAFNSIMAQAFQTAKLEYGDWENSRDCIYFCSIIPNTYITIVITSI